MQQYDCAGKKDGRQANNCELYTYITESVLWLDIIHTCFDIYCIGIYDMSTKITEGQFRDNITKKTLFVNILNVLQA